MLQVNQELLRESQMYTQKCKKVLKLSYKCGTGEPSVVQGEPHVHTEA